MVWQSLLLHYINHQHDSKALTGSKIYSHWQEGTTVNDTIIH